MLPDEAVGTVELDHSPGPKERQGSQLSQDLGDIGLVGIELSQTHGPVATLEDGFAELGQMGVTESAGLAGNDVHAFYGFRYRLAGFGSH